MFSLSELMQSGSSKNLGLYSCSVRLGHDPESEVMLLSFLLGSQYPWKFLGNLFPIFNWFLPRSEFFSLLFHVLYQSVIACLGLDLKCQKYSIFWKVTGKETIFKVTPGIQRPCHVI